MEIRCCLVFSFPQWCFWGLYGFWGLSSSLRWPSQCWSYSGFSSNESFFLIPSHLKAFTATFMVNKWKGKTTIDLGQWMASKTLRNTLVSWLPSSPLVVIHKVAPASVRSQRGNVMIWRSWILHHVWCQCSCYDVFFKWLTAADLGGVQCKETREHSGVSFSLRYGVTPSPHW